jgi:hypothetical protein
MWVSVRMVVDPGQAAKVETVAGAGDGDVGARRASASSVEPGAGCPLSSL